MRLALHSIILLMSLSSLCLILLALSYVPLAFAPNLYELPYTAGQGRFMTPSLLLIIALLLYLPAIFLIRKEFD